MEKRLNFLLRFTGLLLLVLTAGATIAVFYGAFSAQVKGDIHTIAGMLAREYTLTAEAERLEALRPDGYRVTLIGAQGNVLYESSLEQGAMLENHLSRPEVQEALKNGTGEATRTSMTLGEHTYYCAQRLPDGSVLRLAYQTGRLNRAFSHTVPIILCTALGIFLVSMGVSSVLTKRLVAPIEAMADHLEDIEGNVPYEELLPFARAMQEQQEKKRENERQRREFTANVSHELKTPLTSISGYAQMIESGMAKEEDMARFAGKINGEADRLIRLIGDILELSQMDEPGRAPELVPLDLYQAAEETAEQLRFRAGEAGLALDIAGGPVTVMGSAGLLSELVYNLCDNAIRYNTPGGKVLVEVGETEAGPFLQVSDTGIGIPEEHQARIFERFYRVDKSRSKATGGTGLGLAIVKHAALLHGAQVLLESRVGEGTRIRVVFPPGP